MKSDPRRENGITVRFLAQTIINNTSVNPTGIDKFINSLRGNSEIDNRKFSNLNYYFFLHLEDYGINDKSELDLILWNDEVILPVEIKAFTDANSPSVKKEIIRNYLHVRELKIANEFKFHSKQEIYPVLLYSNSYQKWKRKTNNKKKYFNEHFLLTKGQNQAYPLDNWGRGGYPIPEKYFESPDFSSTVEMINKNLLFITWEDIYIILSESNELKDKAKELYNLKDQFQDEKNSISLINQDKLDY